VKALITGGAGFIGSHLINKLLSENINPIVIDNLSTGDINNLDNTMHEIEFIKGDIRDESLVDKTIKNTDLVFHMAAAVGVKNILNSPLEGISTNIYGSEIVLKSATKYGKRIIIAVIFIIAWHPPTHPLQPIMGNLFYISLSCR
jgi:UDP-glucose 4-epimerase